MSFLESQINPKSDPLLRKIAVRIRSTKKTIRIQNAKNHNLDPIPQMHWKLIIQIRVCRKIIFQILKLEKTHFGSKMLKKLRSGSNLPKTYYSDPMYWTLMIRIWVGRKVILRILKLEKFKSGSNPQKLQFRFNVLKVGADAKNQLGQISSDGLFKKLSKNIVKKKNIIFPFMVMITKREMEHALETILMWMT